MRIIAIASFILLASVSAFAGGGAEGSEDGLSGSIKIAGSSTVYPITVAVAEEFSRIHPDVEIAVQSTGTGGGFANFFVPGMTEINDASRPIKDSERESALENGITPVELRVATDAVTFVVSPEADWIDGLTLEELEMIWNPENPPAYWDEVNPAWPHEPIELYGPTAASGTFDYFTEEIMGEGGRSRGDYQKTEQDNTIVHAVQGSQYAMGYFGMAYYLENEENVKPLAIDGVLPSLESAANGSYTPLSRPIFIYVGREYLEREEVRAFVEFYVDLVDTSLISDVGYVPLNPQQTADVEAVLADALAATE